MKVKYLIKYLKGGVLSDVYERVPWQGEQKIFTTPFETKEGALLALEKFFGPDSIRYRYIILEVYGNG